MASCAGTAGHAPGRPAMPGREGPGLGCSFGNSASLSSSSVAPLALPGVVRKATRMLLDKTGPLHIPPHYWLRAAPWLARFVAASEDPSRYRDDPDGDDERKHRSVDRRMNMEKRAGCGANDQ